MSSKINQNISACLGLVFEDIKSNVMKYEVVLSEFHESQSHEAICKYNFSKTKNYCTCICSVHRKFSSVFSLDRDKLLK